MRSTFVSGTLRVLGVTVTIVVLWAAPVLPAESAGVVFRYIPGRPDVSSEVLAAGVEDGPYLAPEEMTARGPGGWGYAPPYAAEFEASTSTLRSASEETVSQPFGPDLTLEAWVRPLDLTGTIHLLSNRIGEDGAVLGIDQRHPFAEIVVAGTSYRIDAPEEILAGADYWIASSVSYETGTLTLSLYVNGTLRATEAFATSIASPYSIQFPVLVGTTAEDGSGGLELSGSFNGLLYGAAMRRYAANDAYLSTPPPLDGSTYMGLPDFMDLALDDAGLEMDQQIDVPPVDIRHRIFLPHVNDGFIPQGTATEESIVGSDTTQLVYVSYYHRTPTSGLGTRNSIVAEIDVATGSVRRTFRLMGRLETSHAGGIAHAHGALYVSSAGYLERYPLPDFEPGQRYLDLHPDVDGTVSTPSKASYVSAFRDTLWVGDWRTASDVAPYLYAHPLDENGRPVVDDPVVYALPRNIQGVDFFDMNGEVFIFMSRNRSSTEAELLRYRPWQLDPYAVNAPDSVITMPHGIEDLSFFEDGTLWTNSESGTDYYQNGPPSWSTFYPFVYSVPAATLFPAHTLTGVEQDRPGDGARLLIYPNPVGDTATIRLDGLRGEVTIDLYDALGRSVRAVYRGVVAGSTRAFDLSTSNLASGTYVVVVTTPRQRITRPVHVVR